MKKIYDWCFALFIKYKEVFLYLFFGVLSTLVNIVVFALFDKVLGVHYVAANIAAWILSVLFAYATNRKWVFESKSTNFVKEFTLFVGCRVFSGICDMGIMIVCVEWLHIDSMIAKLFTQVVVVVLNYIFSKLIIFKKK